jgi:hypothetical protein
MRSRRRLPVREGQILEPHESGKVKITVNLKSKIAMPEADWQCPVGWVLSWEKRKMSKQAVIDAAKSWVGRVPEPNNFMPDITANPDQE